MIQRRDKKRTASAKRIQAAFLEENHIDIEEIRKITVLSNKEIEIEFECGITVRETL